MNKKIVSLIFAALLISANLCVFGAEFSDVCAGDWFYTDITEMSAKGLVNGYPDGRFMPDSTISAAEFVTIAARLRNIGVSAAQNNHWAGGTMQRALDLGWYDWDELPPTAELYDMPLKRQLAVKILMKALAPNARGDYVTESAKISDFEALSGRYYEPVLAAYSLGIAKGDNTGRFNPDSSLTRAEACALIRRAMLITDTDEVPAVTSPQPSEAIRGGVSQNGRLHVSGTQLCNQNGEPIILRGMSSHGVQWFPQYADYSAIRATAEYGANLFRIAMYTAEGGYLQNHSLKDKVFEAADAAASLDMYTIIDWHILSDGNPNTHIEEAKAFFSEAAERYKDNPAVIFEICNEPNGNVTWNSDVRPYAAEIINIIRSAGNDSVILVGSPTWSQDLHKAAENPLDADNIMYTCHFYAGTHTGWLRDRISAAISSGLPIFISEWGTSDASGSGGVFNAETEIWLDFMNQNKLSWANWSLCDKNETSAALNPGADLTDGISGNELSESGRLVFAHFND